MRRGFDIDRGRHGVDLNVEQLCRTVGVIVGDHHRSALDANHRGTGYIGSFSVSVVQSPTVVSSFNVYSATVLVGESQVTLVSATEARSLAQLQVSTTDSAIRTGLHNEFGISVVLL